MAVEVEIKPETEREKQIFCTAYKKAIDDAQDRFSMVMLGVLFVLLIGFLILCYSIKPVTF